jgi:dephospho-CoA kinase
MAMIPDQVLVITGPIGSGKSYIAGLFRQRGWQVIDADVIGHELLGDRDLISEIRRRWPSAVTDSSVDRTELAAIVFSEASQLAELESLTHPLIQQRISEWIAGTVGGRVVEVSVSSAIIDGWGPRVVIDASRATREERLLGRGMKVEDIASRMELQPERHEWLAEADAVIENESRGARAVDLLMNHLESK